MASGAEQRGAIRRITFVWNADFSLAGGLRALQELLEGRHDCTLCAIAYHRVTQKSAWQEYGRELAARLHADVREPCRNQLTAAERDAATGDFPAVLAHTSGGVVKLLGSDAIAACTGDVAAFRARLDAAIAAHRGETGLALHPRIITMSQRSPGRVPRERRIASWHLRRECAADPGRPRDEHVQPVLSRPRSPVGLAAAA